MNTTERLAVIGRHYGVATAYPEHQILDHLDKKAGIDTNGGKVPNPLYGYNGDTRRRHPINYIGTRIRLHEEHISKQRSCGTVTSGDEKTRLSFTPAKRGGTASLYFWLGEEGSRIGETFYMNLKGYR